MIFGGWHSDLVFVCVKKKLWSSLVFSYFISYLFRCWYSVCIFKRIIWPSCECWALFSRLELEELAWTHDSLHINIYFLALSVKASRSNNTPIWMSTSLNHISVAKHWSPTKETRTPWRTSWFCGWSKEITWWNQNILWCQKVRKCLENDWDISKRHKSQLRRD